MPYAKAIASAVAHQEDLILSYVRDLETVVDLAAIRGARLTLGVDPLGGAAQPYWEPINALYDLDIAVVNFVIGPTFSSMTVDHDGKIRMDPSSRYAMAPLDTRIDAPATPAQKARLAKLSPEAVETSTRAGEPITGRLTRAPGNDAPIGGLKVVARRGWFAARPSGTENIYKIYAESFVDQAHLDIVVAEARAIVDRAMGSSA